MSRPLLLREVRSRDARRLPRAAPEAIDNTWKIAEQCDLELEFGRLHLPAPELPPGETTHEFLERLCWEGLRRRLPDADDRRGGTPALRARGDRAHRLHQLHPHRARDRHLRPRRRASASACAAAPPPAWSSTCLGVTDIDPLQANLVFERFLNKERPEAPDVDFDLPDDRREEVLRFVAERYGADRVAQIITFGTLGAKAADPRRRPRPRHELRRRRPRRAPGPQRRCT